MTANASDANSEYILQIGLNVLEHLGINLYSNIPAVLSEVVANAWDADATMVNINIKPDKTIIIEDNGIGMTRAEVKERYLMVGYQRRESQPGLTKRKRKPMGRKGIGKLSLFSIAKTVEIYTSKRAKTDSSERKSALRMELDEIRKQISETQDSVGKYHPQKLSTKGMNLTEGTRIILSNLKKSQIRPQMLRRNLARRFSIIGEQHNFHIKINGKLITPSDRRYFTSLRYLWVFGKGNGPRDLCSKLDTKNGFNKKPVLKKSNIQVTGWIGAVHKVENLKDEERGGEGNLNRIAIYARGKMLQEDILADLGKRGIFSSYLVGELDVEGLDQYDGKGKKDLDAATTSRQRIVEDDPRYKILRDLINKEVTTIGNSWLKWRGEKGLELAKSIPAIQEWLNGLPPDTKKKASSWLTKVGKSQGDNLDDKKRSLKHAVIAFEFYSASQNLGALERFQDDGLDAALRLFNDLDEFERSLYGHIVNSRIQVIKTLQEKCDSNEVEKVIQKHIYDHLWLIDPSWERTEADSYMEKSIGTILSNIELTKEEKASRLDINYRTTSGKHVIIELKRPERTVSVYELAKQIHKYRTPVMRKMEQANLGPLEIVCVLGKQPTEYDTPGGPEIVQKTMEASNARIVYYDSLLAQAGRAYQDYLKADKAKTRLMNLLKDIEDFSIDTETTS